MKLSEAWRERHLSDTRRRLDSPTRWLEGIPTTCSAAACCGAAAGTGAGRGFLDGCRPEISPTVRCGHLCCRRCRGERGRQVIVGARWRGWRGESTEAERIVVRGGRIRCRTGTGCGGLLTVKALAAEAPIKLLNGFTGGTGPATFTPPPPPTSPVGSGLSLPLPLPLYLRIVSPETPV